MGDGLRGASLIGVVVVFLVEGTVRMDAIFASAKEGGGALYITDNGQPTREVRARYKMSEYPVATNVDVAAAAVVASRDVRLRSKGDPVTVGYGHEDL